MTDLKALSRRILEEMPPETRFQQEDARLLAQHADLILARADELARGFYDVLFAHPPTARVFREGERPEREAALKRWLEVTLRGPVDENYWAWQAWVGLIHALRGVSNPMMIAMWSWALSAVGNLLSQLVEEGEVAPGDAARLLQAFHRLAATATALISESYLEHYLEAIGSATGADRELLDRLVRIEIERLREAKERYVPRPET